MISSKTFGLALLLIFLSISAASGAGGTHQGKSGSNGKDVSKQTELGGEALPAPPCRGRYVFTVCSASAILFSD